MVRISLGGLLVVIGIALLLHVTYEAIKYRELLKLLQEEFESLPNALTAEVAAGSVIATAGAFLLAGSLRPITATKQGRASDVGGLRTDFVSFNLRSKAFPLNLPPLK